MGFRTLLALGVIAIIPLPAQAVVDYTEDLASMNAACGTAITVDLNWDDFTVTAGMSDTSSIDTIVVFRVLETLEYLCENGHSLTESGTFEAEPVQQGIAAGITHIQVGLRSDWESLPSQVADRPDLQMDGTTWVVGIAPTTDPAQQLRWSQWVTYEADLTDSAGFAIEESREHAAAEQTVLDATFAAEQECGVDLEIEFTWDEWRDDAFNLAWVGGFGGVIESNLDEFGPQAAANACAAVIDEYYFACDNPEGLGFAEAYPKIHCAVEPEAATWNDPAGPIDYLEQITYGAGRGYWELDDASETFKFHLWAGSYNISDDVKAAIAGETVPERCNQMPEYALCGDGTDTDDPMNTDPDSDKGCSTTGMLPMPLMGGLVGGLLLARRRRDGDAFRQLRSLG